MLHANANKHLGCIGEDCPHCPKLDLPGYEFIRANLMGLLPAPIGEPPVPRGPGTELKKLLAQLGVVAAGVPCDCNAHAAQMDAWGADGCREHRGETVAWLREGQTKWGWAAKLKAAALAVVTGLAFTLDWSDPFPSLVDEAIRRSEFTTITTRNLLYHAAPFSAHGGPWRRAVRNITDRWPLFNGRKIVAIMTGPAMDSPDEVRRAFGPHAADVEFIELPNEPGSNTAPGREVISFLPLFERAESTTPTEATFWAHTKSATHDSAHPGHLWGDVMAELCLDYWPVVDRLLRQFPVAGTFRKLVHAWQPRDGFHSQSDWHYSGSFFWFRHDRLFTKPDWRRIDQFFSGIESYPSLHFPVEQSGVIFEPNTQIGLALYGWDYWAHQVLPRLTQWRQEHAGDRRMP